MYDIISCSAPDADASDFPAFHTIRFALSSNKSEELSVKKQNVFPVIAIAIFALCVFIFESVLFSSGLFPKRMVALSALLLILTGLLFLTLIFSKKYSGAGKICAWIACFLSAILLIVSIYVGLFVKTAKHISIDTKIEVSVVNVYMLADETTDQTELSADMIYGVLGVQDRENTEHMIAELEKELNTSIRTKNYDGLVALLDGLYQHEVQAIVLNSAFLDLMQDMEGYENISRQLRVVKNVHVEKEVPVNPGQNDEGKEDKADKNESDGAPSIITMYISGIDSRTGLIDKSRSDVNIIAVINFNTHQIFLLTTPRDYYVPLSISNGVRDKLTHAGIYGINVSMDTLEMLYDIDFDYYFRVNFEGFIDIIEALGGVTVYLDKELTTTEYTFPAGENELNGYKALSFVRNRFGIGDRQRGYNQMNMVKGVIEKVLSSDALMNYTSLLKAVEGSFETSMPYDVISVLVRRQMETNASWEILTYAVNGEGASRSTFSMNEPLFVFLPDEATVEIAKEQFAKIYNNERLEQLTY